MKKRGKKSWDKKAISKNLILLGLIIAIVIVLVVIIIGIINENKKSLGIDDPNMEISQVLIINDSVVNIKVKKNTEEKEYEGILFRVYDKENNLISEKNISMSELQENNFEMDFHVEGVSNIEKISLSPIITSVFGKQKISDIEDEIFSEQFNKIEIKECILDIQCNDSLPCTQDICSGNICFHNKISSCMNNDGCCPSGCTYSKDKDCKPSGGGGGGGGGGGTPCTNTCASLAYQCGIQNICGVNINCGTCPNDYYCSTSGLCLKNNTCTDTCNSLGYQCGTKTICGESVNCGTCTSNYSCAVNGTCIINNSCTPTTCAALGRTCGNISNGCGGTLNCGNCATNYSCQTNGTCILTPCTDNCSSLNYVCGNQTICGLIVNCGNCSNGYYCSSGKCLACTTQNYSACYNGDVYWYNSCGTRETIRYDCNSTQNCTNGACMNTCLTHNYSACYNGDVYWYNSCGTRETIRYDCNSTQNCTNGACMNTCLTHNYSACYNGDVYWYNSCGTRETIRYDCNSTQTCSSGTCVNNPINPPSTGAIIADHNAARNFDIIPECWLQKARNEISLGYQHTSHGSQIPSGMSYLRTYVNSILYAYSGSNVTNSLYFRDYDISGSGGYNAPDLGYSYWDEATRAYLDTHSNINTIMWSWCGQVSGYTTYAGMSSHYLAPAENIVDNYDINLIYMTGHLDGTGPTGNVYTANNIIRQHVRDINGTLFDFADIESYDPDGNYYPSETDACAWCTTWCTNNPSDCVNLPSCAHSHGFNCVQKGRAYWWMMARIVGWDGTAGDACP